MIRILMSLDAPLSVTGLFGSKVSSELYALVGSLDTQALTITVPHS
jgi:hypothetical protein